MKLELAETDLLDEEVEKKFKDLFVENNSIFKENKYYDLTIRFFNSVDRVGDLDWVDFDVEDVLRSSDYYEQVHKIKSQVEALNIHINHITAYGSNRLSNPKNIEIELAEKDQEASASKVRVIESEELYIFKHHVILLNKLMERGAISEADYHISLLELSMKYHIPLNIEGKSNYLN